MPRILIADDHTPMRRILHNLFAHYDRWEVCGEAADGKEAVDAAVMLRPDLVLLDYRMPNKNGIQAASEIKQKLPEMPIVIFTLAKTRELESKAREVGVNAVIDKEEGLTELLHAVDEEVRH